MDVLACLASRAGAVVSHDEAMAVVWGERFVNEYALTRCIADLRRALGEDARHTQYIENIPKRGYRVIVPVGPAEAVAEIREAARLNPLSGHGRRRRGAHPRLRGHPRFEALADAVGFPPG